MAQKNYHTILTNIVSELKNNAAIKVVDSFIEEPLVDALITMVEMDTGLSFGQSIKELYVYAGSCNIHWVSKIEFLLVEQGVSSQVEGHIQILDLPTVVHGPDGNSWKNVTWFDHTEPDKIKDLKKLLPFDLGKAEEVICLKINEKNFVDDDLFLLTPSTGKLTDLNTRLPEYFKNLEYSKGIEGWQLQMLRGLQKQSPIDDIINELFKK